MSVLVTGAAGFIGMHTPLRLLEQGDEAVDLDKLDADYGPALEASRERSIIASCMATVLSGSATTVVRKGIRKAFASRSGTCRSAHIERVPKFS